MITLGEIPEWASLVMNQRLPLCEDASSIPAASNTRVNAWTMLLAVKGPPFWDGAYILNYTTNENIVPILEAIQTQSKTEFLIQLCSGIPFLWQQRVALVLA